MNLTPQSIENYCLKHSTDASSLLQQIERETHLKTTQPNMISGPIQGAFLGEMVRMLEAKNVLEIGTFTGYTTVWIAENLAENGMITTIEVNPETHWLANQFFDKFQYKNRINSLLGDAGELIPELTIEWDFVLIDAGKMDNDLYYEMVLPSVRKGGYIFVDNVLWKAKMLDKKKDKRTEAIDTFNKKVVNDNRVSSLMLPLRDGLTLIRKL